MLQLRQLLAGEGLRQTSVILVPLIEVYHIIVPV
jgi:hypothetical protein